MSWNLVSDAEVRGLPVPDRLFMFARAYLESAEALCCQLASAPEKCTWANGAVVLMLSAHATELFLKSALLHRMPQDDVWSRGHSITRLTEDYRLHFTEAEFTWEVPFRVEVPVGLTPEELSVLETLRDAPPSILYRYPVDKTGQDWRGLYSFEPNSFLPVLEKLQNDFTRIRSLLA